MCGAFGRAAAIGLADGGMKSALGTASASAADRAASGPPIADGSRRITGSQGGAGSAVQGQHVSTGAHA